MSGSCAESAEVAKRVAIVMPTIPRRAEAAAATVARLSPQCDQLYVHLDGYQSVPSWVPANARSFVHPQKRGPSVRYSVVPEEKYVLFVDDDLQHPSDYAKQAIRALKRSGRRAAVAYHAAWWAPDAPPRYRARKVTAYWDGCEEDQHVTYVGSGTLAIRRADLLDVDLAVPDVFSFEDDVWISAALARAGIRCVRGRSRKDWIRQTSTGDQGLWNEASEDGFKKRDACIALALAMGSWSLTR